MSTERRAPVRRQPLLLSLAVALFAVSLFALLTAALAQARPALPVTAAARAASLPQAAPAQIAPAQAGMQGDDPLIEYAPDVVLVKLKPGAVQAQAGALSAQTAQSAADVATAAVVGLFQPYGVIAAEPLLAGRQQSGFSISAGSADSAALAQGAAGGALQDVYRLHLAPELDARQMAYALAADANVQYAEPDYIARPARVPNDPEYATQWALAQIGAPAAWDVQTGSPDVLIAVIDSGVDTAHPEFAGRLWENNDPLNGIDDDLNGQVDDLHGWNVLANSADLTDPSGHGTQVGGILGAAADNGVGVAGMCWGCKLMFVNAMQASGAANYSDIAEAVQYAHSNGAQVINLSLGGYADSALLREAIQEASTTAVIVAGAGNDDSASPFYPAAYAEVLAVAATDQADAKAVFSNYGPWVDLAAPGVDIRTTTIAGYATDSGSSLSTAFVSAVAGLVKSQHPAWTASQVKWQLLNTATNIDAANPTKAGQLGRGRIDAAASLAANPQAQAAVVSFTVDGQANARPAPGQSFSLVLALQNQWLPAQNLWGTLSSSDPNVSITDAAGAFGDIAPGQSSSNAADPFAVSVSAGAPYNAQLSFTLNLSGDGGYSLAVPFNIQVRSSVETLGNTQYSQDTTWTNDKTYVLAGSVIVGQGVTLTIQPGTVIKADGGKFIRVDGTLIAQGTAEQPILFGTNSITDATWSGLRFSDNATDSRYDSSGAYVGGSVLQYVDISRADSGINLGTRSLLIANSTFHNNSVSINSSGGSPHIQRNQFTGGSSYNMYLYGNITLNGGAAQIRQNRFTAVGSSITGSGSPEIVDNVFQDNQSFAVSMSGSPVIVGNVFTGNGTAINARDGSPQIRDNVVTGNSGSISTSSLQKVDIDHNLIAGNGSGVGLDVQSAPSPYELTLAYNSTDDEYLVAWSESNGMSAPQLWVARAAGDGQPLGPARPVMAGAESSIAYNPVANEYLAATTGGAWGSVTIRRLNAAGAPLASETVITSTYGTQVRVVYQAGDPSYLIAYGAGMSGDTFAQRVAVDGSLVGSPTRIGGSNNGIAGLAYDEQQNRSLATFVTYGSNLNGAWIAPTAASSAAFLLGRHPQWQPISGVSTAYGAGVGRYFSAWNTNGDWNSAQPVWGSVTGADGSAIISATAIYSQPNVAAFEPQVAFAADSNQFLVGLVAKTPITQTLNNLVAAQLVDGNGSPVGSPITVAAANSSSFNARTSALVYNSARHEFLFAWADDRGGSSAIYGQRLSSAAALLDNAWSPANEAVASTNFRLATVGGVRNNTIINNRTAGITLSGQAAAVLIHDNNLFGNAGYDIQLNSGSAGSQNFTVDASNNFWNVPDAAIAGRIRDCTFDENGCGTASATVGKVAYSPALGEPVQAAPAFVRDVTMNPNPVGLEQGALIVEFSRPMDTNTTTTAYFQQATNQPQFAFDNGQWLSPTRWQATRDFNALVAAGSYTVTIERAVDSDGMPVFVEQKNAFTVDFGAGVTLDPPSPPAVQAQTSGSLSNLSAAWQNSSPNVDQYRYAIGTSLGARDIVGWTYLAAASFVRDNLNLVLGQPYYVSVQAHNTSGLWSGSGVSNVVFGGQAPTPTPTGPPSLYLPQIKR